VHPELREEHGAVGAGSERDLVGCGSFAHAPTLPPPAAARSSGKPVSAEMARPDLLRRTRSIALILLMVIGIFLVVRGCYDLAA